MAYDDSGHTCLQCGFFTASYGGLARHCQQQHGADPAEIELEHRRAERKAWKERERRLALVAEGESREAEARTADAGTLGGASAAEEVTQRPSSLDTAARDATWCTSIRENLQALRDVTEGRFGSASSSQPPPCDARTSGASASYDYQTLSTKVRALYDTLGDMERSEPIVEPRRNSKPGRFSSARLRALERFCLRVGGVGLSSGDLVALYQFLGEWDKAGEQPDGTYTRPPSLRDVFPTHSAFVSAIRDDIHAAVLSAGWRKVQLTEGGVSYEAFFRPVLDVVLDILAHSDCVRLWSGEDGPAPPSDRRETPMDGDAFRVCEKEVVEMNGPGTCVIGLHAYSDSSQLSWSGGKSRRRQSAVCALLAFSSPFLRVPEYCIDTNAASAHALFLHTLLASPSPLVAHKLYPVRIRVVNTVGECKWVPVAFIPTVRTLQEPAAAERGRQRRSGVLQRVLYSAFRSTIAASHSGEPVTIGGRTVTIFPRLLLYLCDQPEERAVLCLKGGQCRMPCSMCDTISTEMGVPEALNAHGREVVVGLHRQLEAFELRQHGRDRGRRLYLEAQDSSNGFVPALSAMAGLSTTPYLLYSMIGFDILHIMDQGVTRMLMHRLMRVLPYVCGDVPPITGSLVACRRVANNRLPFLGRRSKACKAPPGYAVTASQTQSVFTGKQQRDGVSILPFLVMGVCGPKRAALVAALTSSRDVDERTVPDLAADALPFENDGESVQAEQDHYYMEDDDDEADATKVPSDYTFDWAAYRSVWGDTPFDDAVTEMFAEYAVLYARMAGHVCSAVPPPMTLAEGLSIADQATRFITQYVNTILGPILSTKVHKLLSHVMTAIRMHGNLRNGNTAENEAQHKEDKHFYGRTNKDTHDFTRQLVIRAQGAREVLQQIDSETQVAASRAAADEVDGGATDEESPPGRGNATAAGPLAAGAMLSRYRHLQRATMGALAARPGMACAAAIMGVDEDSLMAVLSHVYIQARFDCGTTTRQLVRAAPSFNRAPWYDAVMFTVEDGEDTHLGEVRVIVRREDGDYALVCDMAVVDSADGCPLTKKGCTRVAWMPTEDESALHVRLVPISRIVRLLHIVPDFCDLASRRGLLAAPTDIGGPVADLLDMRYFVNAFYPWDVRA